MVRKCNSCGRSFTVSHPENKNEFILKVRVLKGDIMKNKIYGKCQHCKKFTELDFIKVSM